jgi:hypothetical protein
VSVHSSSINADGDKKNDREIDREREEGTEKYSEMVRIKQRKKEHHTIANNIPKCTKI